VDLKDARSLNDSGLDKNARNKEKFYSSNFFLQKVGEILINFFVGLLNLPRRMSVGNMNYVTILYFIIP
jgi:hypothetical protein